MTQSARIAAGAAKITIPLRADQFPTGLAVPEPNPQPDVHLIIDAAGSKLSARLKGKAYRKVVKSLVPGAFVVLQGKLGPDGELLEAGMVVQPPRETVAALPAEASVGAV